LDKSKREELNKESKEGNEVKKVNELKEKIKLSFDHVHQQDDDAFEDFELPSNANNNNNNNNINNTFTNNKIIPQDKTDNYVPEDNDVSTNVETFDVNDNSLHTILLTRKDKKKA